MMSPPLRWPLLCLGLLLCACNPSTPQDDAAPVAPLDTLQLDLATPSTHFDASGGSLLLGEGWDPPQTEPVEGRGEIAYAWTVDGSARFWSTAPIPEPGDLLGECLPLSFPGAPPQEVEVWRAEERLGQQTLQG